MQTYMAQAESSPGTLSTNLKRFRSEAGLSRAQLSLLSGVPEKNLVRYENGETRIPGEIVGDLP